MAYDPVDPERMLDIPDPGQMTGKQHLTIERVTGADIIAVVNDVTGINDPPRYPFAQCLMTALYASAMQAGLNYRWSDVCELTFDQLMHVVGLDDDTGTDTAPDPDHGDDDVDQAGEDEPADEPDPTGAGSPA